MKLHVGYLIFAAILLLAFFAKASAPKSCTVTVQRGTMTPGTQCLWNRVMTGITGSYILCSDLTVECAE